MKGNVVDLEEARAARMERALGPARFGHLEVSGGRVIARIDARLTPASARLLSLMLASMADEAEGSAF